MEINNNNTIGGDGTSCMEKGVQNSWQDPGPGASSKPAQKYANVNRRRWRLTTKTK